MFWSAVLSVCVYFSLVVSQQCPEYSVYSDCGCVLTCEYPYPSEECSENCEPGCYCSPGYFLRSDGQCVPYSQCHQPGNPPNTPPDTSTSYQCNQDEQYYHCTPNCKNTCENFNNPRAECNCGQPACFCREGLVKRKDGKCVPPKECQEPVPAQNCPPDAIYIECGSECAPTCEEPRLRTCGGKCVSGCFCKPGFLLTKDGTGCVPPQHCNLKSIPKPPVPKCPERSVFIRCGSNCAPTCDSMNPAPCGNECVTACFCIPGYLMNRNGTRCVSPDQCEKPSTVPARNYAQGRCGVDEQYYECTPSCRNTCLNYNSPIKCGCGPPGCFCREGLVKNPGGKCVHPKACAITPPKCFKNAMFVPCGSPCAPTCENPHPAPCSQRCEVGCFCLPGFLKAANGRCVKPEECNPKNVTIRCGENADYSECGPACPETCENTQPGKVCIAACVPGCFCKPGFVLAKDGKCVATQMCDKKCSLSEEEYLECGPACPDTCDNRNLNPSYDSLCPHKCVRGCFCKKGLFRDRKGACVTGNKCPTQQTPTYTATTSTEPGVADNGSRGCPNQKLCEAFCRSHKLRNGYCVGNNRKECRCS